MFFGRKMMLFEHLRSWRQPRTS